MTRTKHNEDYDFYLDEGDVFFWSFWQNGIRVDGTSSDPFLITKPMYILMEFEKKIKKLLLECI